MVLREMGSGATRRGFLGGLATTGAALALPSASRAATVTPPCTPKAPGIRTAGLAVTPDRRTVWTTDNAGTTITAHRGRKLARRKSIDVGGAPLDIAITPDGHFALVTTAFYDRPGLAVVRLHTGHVARVDVGPEPGSVAFERHARVAWVAGGGSAGTLTGVDLKTGHAHAPIAIGNHPRGLALLPDGKHALVALNGQSSVALVTLATGHVRHIATRAFPQGVAVSPDGKHAIVTHSGFGDHAITPIDLVRHRAHRPVNVGKEPIGGAYTRSGRNALVAVTGGHAVVVVNGRTGHRRRTIRRLDTPRAVAVAGRHAIVADGRTGQLKKIRLGAHA
jgi:DNA-binding beta-propeller fold protein YncE